MIEKIIDDSQPSEVTAVGKSVLVCAIMAIIDPREDDEALVQRMPRDEKDRRVTIYSNHVSFFDNETALTKWTELCTWVTGYSI